MSLFICLCQKSDEMKANEMGVTTTHERTRNTQHHACQRQRSSVCVSIGAGKLEWPSLIRISSTHQNIKKYITS